MFIFTTRTMFPSAKALANKLSDITGTKVRVTTRPDTKLTGHYLRWGSSGLINGNFDEQAAHIRCASNKRLFSDRMIQIGIPCVEIRHDFPEHFPVVARKTVTGFGGAGITVARDLKELTDASVSHWSYFRNFSPELGVHIVNGEIIRLFKKVATDDTPQEEYPIRNATRGYHFSQVNLDNYPKLIPFVQNFCEKFPIKLGRMDVGWDFDEKTYRVIEFNTAPCLTNNDNTLQAYAEALSEDF